MSRYYRFNPEQPICHDWLSTGPSGPSIKRSQEPPDAPICDECREEYDGNEQDHDGICPECAKGE